MEGSRKSPLLYRRFNEYALRTCRISYVRIYKALGGVFNTAVIIYLGCPYQPGMAVSIASALRAEKPVEEYPEDDRLTEARPCPRNPDAHALRK